MPEHPNAHIGSAPGPNAITDQSDATVADIDNYGHYGTYGETDVNQVNIEGIVKFYVY